MANIDARGVERGNCTVCVCAGYDGGVNRLKCTVMGCGHPPGKHHNMAAKSSYQRSHSFQDPAATPTPSYAGAASSGVGHGQHSSYGGYTPSSYDYYQKPLTQPCKAPGCTKHCHYDSKVGEFDYCSPNCRDKALLVHERQHLQEDLKRFKDTVKHSAPLAAAGKHESSPGQTRGGNLDTFYDKDKTSVNSRYEHSNQSTAVSGQQLTWKVFFQKSPSKDIGLILAEDIYRNGSISGLLVLGFEFNTKAEHLLESGEVHLLDVITHLNDKEASPFTYTDQIKNKTGSLILNRSIALPKINELFAKVKFSNPTYLVAVRNPSDIPYCSVEKGFGLTTTTQSGNSFVSSTTKNTPARVSRLKYGDEIIAYGFVKNSTLEIQKGALMNSSLEAAASDGKTLILVYKRP